MAIYAQFNFKRRQVFNFKMFIYICLLCSCSTLKAQIELGHNIQYNGVINADSDYKFSADGTLLIIGDYLGSVMNGSVKVFETTDGVNYELMSTIKGPELGSKFGCSVDISDDSKYLAIGAKEMHETGCVFVYERFDDNWELICELRPNKEVVSFGDAVAISSNGNIVAVGAPNYGSNKKGSCFIFNLEDDIETPYIINAKPNENRFGRAVSINNNGHIIAIGSSTNNGKEKCGGAINVFSFEKDGYLQLGNIITLSKETCYSFGSEIAISDNGLTVASGMSSKKFSALIWTLENDTWEIKGQGIPKFGGSKDHSSKIELHPKANKIALSKGFGENAGEAMVYYFDEKDWKTEGEIIKSEKGLFSEMAFNFPKKVMAVIDVDKRPKIRAYQW